MPGFSDDLFLGSSATYMGTGTAAATSIFSGLIVGTTLTVVNPLSGDPIVVGQYITGTGVTANTYITGNISSNVYSLSQSSTVVPATTLYAAGNALLGDPSPMPLGVGPLGRIYNFDVIPQTLQLANIAASQTPAGPGSLVLTPGISATSVTRSNGQVVIQLDCPRAVSISQAAGVNELISVYGYDYYGQAMSQMLSTAAGATVTTLKAFYQISSVIISGAPGSAITVGTSDVIGIPIRVIDGGYLVNLGWAGSIAIDTGTFVPADTTAVASVSTGDVRGTYKPSTATNGIKRLVLSIAVNGIQVGPNSTRTGALGVTQA